MHKEAIIDIIAERIQQEIGKAQKSAFFVVAWFTNKNISNELVNKARNGCTYNLPETFETDCSTNDIPSNIVLNGGD